MSFALLPNCQDRRRDLIKTSTKIHRRSSAESEAGAHIYQFSEMENDHIYVMPSNMPYITLAVHICSAWEERLLYNVLAIHPCC
ncbi:hypothetical protein XELAEV_18038998mg [Xenopus laevis]|uniref:Uncharacterized protein n=1 Tax=Xenopus laevis TaxID=8355 RepID=A0A974H7Y8_XENLA|nr:hypothetical protein XELAEV_18038998mg [Xenopus laevis]